MASGKINVRPIPVDLIKDYRDGNTESITIAGTSIVSKTVTFSPAFADDNYIIILAMNCSNNTYSAFGQIQFSFHSKTKNGFSIKIYNSSTGERSGFNVHWTALKL